MISVVILGAGNVAYHLAQVFNQTKEVDLKQLYNRNIDSFKEFPEAISKTDNLNDLVDANLYIIAVSDDAIKNITNEIPFENKLVVHTAGSKSLKTLHSKNRKGVFYPLQTFTKGKSSEFKTIPICIEAEEKIDLELLDKLGKSISNSVQNVNSKQRKSLHLAAVYVNNFVNHLYHIGDTICQENQVSFDLLKPLINETANKTNDLSPLASQTGPAKRNDKKTMQMHLKSLKSKSNKAIYTLLSKSIKNTYGKEL